MLKVHQKFVLFVEHVALNIAHRYNAFIDLLVTDIHVDSSFGVTEYCKMNHNDFVPYTIQIMSFCLVAWDHSVL